MDTTEFLNGYITAMLWSSMDDSEDSLEGYELAPEALAQCEADCLAFMAVAARDLTLYESERHHAMEYGAAECAGHDFWLTRAGHGVGFWDRGLDELGDRLTALCGHGTAFPSLGAYVGDDGLVYLS